MSGIARPENFENAVEQLGGKVEIRRRYPDHYWFDQNDLEAFVERCADRAMDLIVTTEKMPSASSNPGKWTYPSTSSASKSTSLKDVNTGTA